MGHVLKSTCAFVERPYDGEEQDVGVVSSKKTCVLWQASPRVNWALATFVIPQL
jgi:hypothetical protein